MILQSPTTRLCPERYCGPPRIDLADVGAIVLESDGSLSVIPAQKMGGGSALEGVDMNDAG